MSLIPNPVLPTEKLKEAYITHDIVVVKEINGVPTKEYPLMEKRKLIAILGLCEIQKEFYNSNTDSSIAQVMKRLEPFKDDPEFKEYSDLMKKIKNLKNTNIKEYSIIAAELEAFISECAKKNQDVYYLIGSDPISEQGKRGYCFEIVSFLKDIVEGNFSLSSPKGNRFSAIWEELNSKQEVKDRVSAHKEKARKRLEAEKSQQQ